MSLKEGKPALFFKSFRYSEDMDLDIQGVKADILKSIVMKILQALSFQDILKPFGVERVVPPDIGRAKQTEATRRFKIHLITYAGEDLFTKVEFSRRGFRGKPVVQSVSNTILREYKLAPLLVPHYDIQSAIMQRIGALAGRITAPFFDGFTWYKGTGSFLTAEPEKALVDCLYLSACKKKQFGYFPELHFPKSFSFRKAKKWAKKIPDFKISLYAQKRLDVVLSNPS